MIWTLTILIYAIQSSVVIRDVRKIVIFIATDNGRGSLHKSITLMSIDGWSSSNELEKQA